MDKWFAVSRDTDKLDCPSPAFIDYLFVYIQVEKSAFLLVVCIDRRLRAMNAFGVTSVGNIKHNVTWESGDGDLTNTDTPSQKFTLGQITNNNNNLDGDIESFSIWNRILTSSEITSLYTSTAVGQGLDPWVEKGTA